jgi:putative heme-binding domain-containing protein
MKWVLPLLFATSLIGHPARVPWASNAVKGSPEPPSPYTVERLYTELDIQRTVDLTFAPNSNDLFIATERAQIWHVDTSVTPATQHLLADIHDHHYPVSNVLGFTFHPDFQKNRYIYINYNEGGERDLGAHIARFELTVERPYQLIAESKKVLIRWASGGHNGCTLAFGPDGYLYFSTGDGAVPDPPDSRFLTGQDINDIMASIQRIDVDRESDGLPYAIPPDNPFINHKNARPEVWAFGFRNPFRMAFDQQTGELWAGDVGWEQWEMIYRIEKGGNYGWAATEGPNPRVLTDIERGPSPILPPMVAHPHSEAASMTGGQAYYGKRYPDLHGTYIYGDWETGRIWALRNQENQLTSHRELGDTSLKPVSFALDPQGELLILDHNSGIYGLVPNPVLETESTFPIRLSETGLFSHIDPLTPAPGTTSYEPIAPMWNDHAKAQWLLGVPGDESMAQRGGVGDITGGNWFYPTNTVLARTLTLQMDTSNPKSERRIETQMLHWDGQEWNPYTYQWNDEQTDAKLVPMNGASAQFKVTDPKAPGGFREIPWRFHSRSECLRCHNVWSGIPLTLNPLQLGSGEGSEMERLTKLGLMASNNRGRNRGRRRNDNTPLVNPHDENQPTNTRARSWLHVNCGSCHIYGAGGGIPSQFNIDKRLSEARAVDVEPTRGNFGITAAKILAAGDPYRSVAAYRMSTESAGHMPQIGSRLVDEKGVAMVMDWLMSMNVDSEASAIQKQADDAVSNGSESAIASLLQSTHSSLALMRIGLRQPGHSWLRNTVAQLAKKENDPFVRGLFEHWLAPDERRETLGADIDPKAILSLAGDSFRGEELFFGSSQCFTCHELNGKGRAFGPDLVQSATRYNQEELIDQILNPSKTAAPEYRSVSITLEDDTEYSGLIREQTDKELVLVDTALNEHRIPKEKIFDRVDSNLSAMPEGLLATLTAQEAADLVSYLASLRP